MQTAAPALFAGRAARKADAARLQEVHEHLAPVARQGDAEDVRRAPADDDEPGVLGQEPLDGARAQRGHALGGLGHELPGKARGLAEGADVRHGLGPGAAALLLRKKREEET